LRCAFGKLARHDTGLTPPDDELPDVYNDLIDRMSRSHAKDLASMLDPDLAVVDRLACSLTLKELEARHAAALAAERVATELHGVHVDQLAEQLARVDHIARHVSVGARVSPADRHNVGTVTALDDDTGVVTVEFVSATGRHATRTFDWAELRLVDAAAPRPLPAAAQRRLDAITTELAAKIEDWHATIRRLASNRATPAATAEPSTGTSNTTPTRSPPNDRRGSPNSWAIDPTTSPAPLPGTTPSPRSPAGRRATPSPTRRL
jgi:hypothetical protein